MTNFMDELTAILEEVLEDEGKNDGNEELDSYIPHLYRSLTEPGFVRLDLHRIPSLTGKIQRADPNLASDLDDGQSCYVAKRLKRSWSFGAYTDLYRRMSAVDPETAASFKYDGVSIADVARVAEQESEQLAACLGAHLPAYVFKDLEEEIVGYEVTSPEILHALLSNSVYYNFSEFGYRDPAQSAEEEFINHLLVYGEQISIHFPSLGGMLHLGNCGQVFIAADSQDQLEQLALIVKPVGELVDA